MDEKRKFSNNHSVTLDDRNNLRMTGIEDVLSFDEELLIAQCELGVIVIKGENLHVNKLDLDNGVVEVDGYIYGLTYEDNHHMSKNKTSMFGKIFK